MSFVKSRRNGSRECRETERPDAHTVRCVHCTSLRFMVAFRCRFTGRQPTENVLSPQQQPKPMTDAETKTTSPFAFSNDGLWELHAEPNGFVMRHTDFPQTAYTFRQIHLERRATEKSIKQVMLLEQSLLGTITQNRVDIANIKTKRNIGSLLGHEDTITALAFRADGRFAITAGDDRTIRLWELPSCRCLRTWNTPKYTIDTVYLDPSGHFALSLTANGMMRLWTVAVLCRPKAFRAPLQLSHAISAEEAGQQQSEMEQACNAIRQAVKQKDYTAALEWTDKAKTLGGWESARTALESEGIGDIIRRHTERQTFDSALCTHTLSGHSCAVTSIAVSRDANVIASADQDGVIRVWNIAEQKCVAELEGHDDEIRSVVLTTDAKFLISGSRDGSVRIWNIGSAKCIRAFGERVMMLTKIALDPQERTVAVADGSGMILLWDVLANAVIDRFSSGNGGINVIRFSRDGQHLATGGNDGSSMFWKVGDSTPIHVFRDHKSPVMAMALSMDGSRCFSADKGGQIVVRNVYENKQEQIFQGHVGEISGLELLSDARFLFSAAKDGSLKVWNLSESMASTWIEGHASAVTAIKLEIAGRRLVTGGADGVVRTWELLWSYHFPGWQPMSSAAESALRLLMSLYSADGVSTPKIDESAKNRIFLEMIYCGFGTIPPETLKQAFADLLADWKNPVQRQ